MQPQSNWKSYPTYKECKCCDHHCSALVSLLQYNAAPCLENLQQPRVSAALHTAGCSRAAPAAGLQICESVLRKIRTQLPGEENSAAAGRGFCSTAAVTAGHSWGSAAAGSWPRHCSQCCRLSTLLPAHCRWSGYAVFTLGFCTMNTFKRIGVERFSKN